MNVAQTILTQLGGNRFAAMTGAKQFVAVTDYLQFKLPANFAKGGINCVKVTLTAADLYDVEFMKVRHARPGARALCRRPAARFHSANWT